MKSKLIRIVGGTLISDCVCICNRHIEWLRTSQSRGHCASSTSIRQKLRSMGSKLVAVGALYSIGHQPLD